MEIEVTNHNSYKIICNNNIDSNIMRWFQDICGKNSKYFNTEKVIAILKDAESALKEQITLDEQECIGKKWSNFDLDIIKELDEKPLWVKKEHANAINSYNNQRKDISNKIKNELIKSINKFFEQIGEVTEEIYEKNKTNEDFFIFTKSKNSQLYEVNSKFFLFNYNYDKNIPIISSSMLTTEFKPLCNKKSNLKKLLILKNELTLTENNLSLSN